MAADFPGPKEFELLREEWRRALDALELAANFSTFRTSMNQLDGPEPILEEAAFRCNTLLKCRAMAFYLVDEETSDFSLRYCTPEGSEHRFALILEGLIEHGAFAWALQRNRPHVASLATAHEKTRQEVLLHTLATPSRIRGMFLALLQDGRRQVDDISMPLLSVALHSCAQMVESQALYAILRSDGQTLQQRLNDARQAREELAKGHRTLERKLLRLETLAHEDESRRKLEREALLSAETTLARAKEHADALRRLCSELVRHAPPDKAAMSVLSCAMEALGASSGTVWAFNGSDCPACIAENPSGLCGFERDREYIDLPYPLDQYQMDGKYPAVAQSGGQTGGAAPIDAAAPWLYVPLLDGDTCVGCLLLHGRGHPFGKADLETATLLAPLLVPQAAMHPA